MATFQVDFRVARSERPPPSRSHDYGHEGPRRFASSRPLSVSLSFPLRSLCIPPRNLSSKPSVHLRVIACSHPLIFDRYRRNSVRLPVTPVISFRKLFGIGIEFCIMCQAYHVLRYRYLFDLRI
jgi:hypothetical protein